MKECYSALERKEFLSRATTWMALEGRRLSETGQTQKGKHCNPTYLRSLEESKPQRQKAGWRAPGARGRGGGDGARVFNRDGIPVLQNGERPGVGGWR